MNIRENVTYYIKKNVFIVLVLIGLCPLLALSYAKFTINSESYRSNEMYISELLYSIKIDNENTYTIDIEPSETEHIIGITSLSGISTNYKLAYLNNDNLEVKYASDYMYASSSFYSNGITGYDYDNLTYTSTNQYRIPKWLRNRRRPIYN